MGLTQRERREWTFRTCPDCGEAGGLPFRATTVNASEISVFMRCGACGYHWLITRADDDPPLLFPKPDRRSAPSSK